MTINTINIWNIEKEIVNFLRNSGVFTPAERGVTEIEDEFTATAGQTEFTLTKSTPRNIITVYKDLELLKFGYDYDFTFESGNHKVTLSTGAGVDDVIKVKYHYGDSDLDNDLIVNALSRTDIQYGRSDSFPRVTYSLQNNNTQIVAFENVSRTAFTIRIDIYGRTVPKTYEYINTLRQYIFDNERSFYTLRYLKISQTTQIEPIDTSDDKKIFNAKIYCYSNHNYEL
jgi:hypothetical protein